MRTCFLVRGWVAGLALCASGGCASLEDDEATGPTPLDLGASISDAGFALDVGIPSVQPACDPVDGTGCEFGQLCRLDGVPTCVEAYAGADRAAACGPGDCGPTLICVRPTETATAAECAKLCVIETGRGCEALSDYDCLRPLPGTPFGVCEALAPLCNPYTQQPCAPSEACQPFLRRSGTREMRCLGQGAAEAGQPCGAGVGGCLRELVCVAEPDGTAATCRRYCELSAECPEPEQCTGRVDDPPFTFCLP